MSEKKGKKGSEKIFWSQSARNFNAAKTQLQSVQSPQNLGVTHYILIG